jgi:multiple sugar transport system permease protein
MVEGPSMTAIGPQAQAQVALPPRTRPLEGGSRVEFVLMHAAFLAIAAFFLAPFVWLFTAAFDAHAQAYIRWPEQFTFDNFVQIFERYAFLTALQNSVLVAVSTMALTVFVVSLAGYSLSRIELRQKAWITYAILLLQTMPLSATMVPIYGLARELGLRNSYLGLILIHSAIELPFLIWLMKGFFDSVPRHLEEAAWLDGRTKFRALFEIVLPVARPGIAVAAGLSFLSAWAEVLMVLILVDQQSMKTIPLAFYETFRTAGGYTEVQYGLVAAMGVLYVLPVMAVFFATRRLMVRGLMSSTRGL